MQGLNHQQVGNEWWFKWFNQDKLWSGIYLNFMGFNGDIIVNMLGWKILDLKWKFIWEIHRTKHIRHVQLLGVFGWIGCWENMERAFQKMVELIRRFYILIPLKNIPWVSPSELSTWYAGYIFMPSSDGMAWYGHPSHEDPQPLGIYNLLKRWIDDPKIRGFI